MNLGRNRFPVACWASRWRFFGTARERPTQSARSVPTAARTSGREGPSTARVPRYPLIERQGILWIWMDAAAEPDHDPTHFEFLEEQPGRRRAFIPAHLVDAPFVNVVENALDNAHLKFIHFGTMNVESTLLPEQTVEIRDDGRGLKAYYGEEPLRQAPELRPDDTVQNKGLFGWLQRQSGLSLANVEEGHERFDLGGVVHFYDRYADGRIGVTYAGITPADDTHTWFFEETVRCFALGPIGQWATVRWMQELFDEDSSLLHDTVLANGAGGLERPVSVTSDKAGLAFRRLYAAAVAAESGEEAEAAE